jgi:hypothetical protein
MPDIDQWFQPLLDTFNSISFQLVLLVSSGILAVSLLLLAMTHWGKSRPVWKCVMLSFAAHILLMGYAYGTRMLGPSPVAAEQAAVDSGEVLNVSIIDDVGEQVVSNPDESEDDHLEVATSTAPTQLSEAIPDFEVEDVPPLQRATLDTELIFETQPLENALSIPTPATKNGLASDDFVAPLPPKAENSFDPDSIGSEAENGFELDVAMLPKAKIIAPDPIEVDRFEQPREPTNELDFQVDSELARTQIQTKSEPLATLQEANAAASTDRQFVASVPSRMPVEAPNWDHPTTMKPIPKPANKLRSLNRTRRLADGKPLPSIYSLRTTKSRLAVARNRGGSVHTEQAVEKALEWLARNQESNGRWDPNQHGAGREDRIFGHNRDGAGANAETGISGLATLAFLGAGHSHLEGQHAETVDKAVDYLVSQQKQNGDLSGNAKLFAKMYCHSMALLALSESLAITGDKKLLSAVQKGVDFSISAQNKIGGGWRYQPGDSGDMSQFGWQVMALKSAKLGGAYVPNTAFIQMRHFLASCSSGIGNGLASYRPRQRPSATMTAEALLCRFFLDQRLSKAGMIEAKRMVMRELPNNRHINLYYWYYGTLAMYHAGGNDWQKWNAAMKETLLPMQQTDGGQAGSWSPTGMWGGYGGRVYSTAVATLSLESYYRYLPVYEEVARQNNGQIR